MSSYKLEYKLKQQTPMIHFQYDQSGATLRATEVKPKLDKFIIKKIGNGDYENGKEVLFDLLKTDEYRDWLIGYKYNSKQSDKKPEHYALNYKLQIVANGNPEISTSTEDAIKKKKEDELYYKYKGYYEKKLRKQEIMNSIRRDHKEEYGKIVSEYKKGINEKNKNSTESIKINGMYFGNQGTKEDELAGYKETVFYKQKQPIDCCIVCFVKSLRDKIDEYISEFFVVTNFGTRQSKGFGGFLVENREATEKNLMDNYDIIIKIKNHCDDDQMLMKYAQVVYSVMKGGINNDKKKDRGYIRGFSRREFLSMNIGSEKAFIKSKNLVPDRVSSHKENDIKYDDYWFIRALLGLTDNYSYKVSGPKKLAKVHVINVDGIIEGEMKNMDEISKTHLSKILNKNKKSEIERFKSPVTIKIVNGYAYFCFEKSYEKILDKTFAILNDNKSVGYYLKTPSSFDLDDFVERFKDYFNGQKENKSFIDCRKLFGLDQNIELEVIE